MTGDQETFSTSYPLGFLARVAATSALGCAVGLGVLWWVFSRDLGGEFSSAFYALKNLLTFLLPALVFCLLAVLLVASVAVFVVAVFASHKVAGPLFRLQRVAGYLERGILVGRIHLRNGDQGRAVSLALNDWVADRKERLRALEAQADAVEAALRRCEVAQAGGGATGRESAWEALRARTRELRHK